METDEITKTQKRQLRREMSALKRSFTECERALRSRRVIETLEKSDGFRAARTILLYFSLPDEVQTAAFITRWAAAKRIVLPVVDGDNLLLREYTPDALSEGYRNIMEPTEEAPLVDPLEIDLALIPGVAFDARCNRLGRGKGFYDRFLQHVKCPVWGLAYDFQLVDQVPVETFDRKLDCVVSESRIFHRQ